MRLQLLAGVAFVASAALSACATAPRTEMSAQAPAAPAPTTATAAHPDATKLPAELAGNPAAAEWTGPYGGVPAFDRIKASDFPAAFEGTVAMRRAEINAIAESSAPPTFENTIVALERSGAAFNRMFALFGVYTANLNDEAYQALERDLSPKIAAASDEITLNHKLFQRIEAVYTSPEKAKLTPEQQRLTWRTHDTFVRAGAKLDAQQKARLSQINQELATLYSAFGQKVLADEDSFITIDKKADLAGLPQSIVDSFQAAAAEKGLKDRWIVTNTRSSVDPFLTYSQSRPLRERVWKAFKGRGDNGDKSDTNATVGKIMPLRAERSKLLGYPTYADWKLGNTMAKTPAAAQKLMLTVWTPALARVKEEVADMRAIAAREGAKITVEPWDYLFYADKVRKAKYDLDQNQLKPYLELQKMIEAAMWSAGRLYGLTFKEVKGTVPVFHPDVRVWEVAGESGKLVGLFYGDYFARPFKRSGAWETAYRQQSRFDGEEIPLVSNNNNFVKSAPGEPVLISVDDAVTLFHEFGHALHELLSNVTYRSLSGTNTATDFVEFPSQVNEHWVLSREVLDKFARHYKTGEAMPQALVDKIKAASKFNQGYSTVEYLSSAIIDMNMHTLPDGKVDSDRFEREELARIGAPREVAMRHRTPQFTHVFTGDGYAAGYYSYLWSETMAADAWRAFEETGNVWDPATAARMKTMMAAGDSIDQGELYRAFRGRDPDVNGLLQQRGFPIAGGR